MVYVLKVTFYRNNANFPGVGNELFDMLMTLR